jgi:hypothetical protein
LGKCHEYIWWRKWQGKHKSHNISYTVTTLRFGRKCLQKNYRYTATCINSSVMCSNLLPMVCDCVFDSKAYICVVKCASTLTPVIVVLLFQLHVIYSNCMYICISYTFMYVHALLQKYRNNLHWNKRFYWVYRRKAWIEFCKRKAFKPSSCTRIRSLHFAEHAYEQGQSPQFLKRIQCNETFRMQLKREALPTLNKPLIDPSTSKTRTYTERRQRKKVISDN